MPSRKPIIPGLARSSHVLKTLHLEMQQRKLRSDTSTSSGIYSNSDISDQGELLHKQRFEQSKNNMGRAQGGGNDTYYGDDRTERENESDSSGPDDDGDDDDVTEDDDDDNTDNDQNLDEELSDQSDIEENDDRYHKEKTVRVNDDMEAWEQANRGIARRMNVPQRYIGDQKLAQFSASHQTTAVAEARLGATRRKGPTSYVRLVKETEDEIELIRRKNGRARQGTQQLTPEQQKELKTKRRSTNSITFLYGRRKENPSGFVETGKRHSVDVSAKRQQREQVIAANSREREVNEHLQRIQGGRISFQPIRTPRSHDQQPASSSKEIVLASAIPHPKPRGARNGYNSDESELVFPLRDMAAGESENQLGVRKARTLETAAKRRTKARKNELAVAKLDVTETRLLEFSATLRARQAKIEEGQAKLCRRRAALKEAEEELDALESKMDAEEEDHRARERRIRNRERRVKQEEAGLALKEESLRKREISITKGIEQIERRRKLVEEKEGMQQSMEEIMLKKEELHGRDMTHMDKTGKGGIFAKLLKKNGRDKSEKIETRRASAGNPRTYMTSNIRSTKSGPEYLSYTADTSDNNHLRNGNDKNRSNSGNTAGSQSKNELKTSTLPRSEGKAKTMGLWI